MEGGSRFYTKALIGAGKPPDFAMLTRGKVGTLEERDVSGRGHLG